MSYQEAMSVWGQEECAHEEDFGPEVQIPCIWQSPQKEEEEEEIPMREEFLDMTDKELRAMSHHEVPPQEVPTPQEEVPQQEVPPQEDPAKIEEVKRELIETDCYFPITRAIIKGQRFETEASNVRLLCEYRDSLHTSERIHKTLNLGNPNPDVENSELAKFFYLSVDTTIRQYELQQRLINEAESPRVKSVAEAKAQLLKEKCFTNYTHAVGYHRGTRAAKKFYDTIKKNPDSFAKELGILPMFRQYAKQKIQDTFGEDPDQLLDF